MCVRVRFYIYIFLTVIHISHCCSYILLHSGLTSMFWVGTWRSTQYWLWLRQGAELDHAANVRHGGPTGFWSPGTSWPGSVQIQQNSKMLTNFPSYVTIRGGAAFQQHKGTSKLLCLIHKLQWPGASQQAPIITYLYEVLPIQILRVESCVESVQFEQTHGLL